MTTPLTAPVDAEPMGGIRAWAQRFQLYRKLAFALTIAAVASGIATAIAWSGASEKGVDPDTISIMLIVDFVLVMVLGALVAVRLVRLWGERRRGLAGSGLLVRMVVMFSLVAVTPAILVAVFAALFLKFGLQSWFSDQVRTAVFASNAVAQAYLEEHRKSIQVEAFAMANDLNRDAPEIMSDPRLFNHRLALQANLRSLPEALVMNGSGQVLAMTPLSLSLQLDLGSIPREAIARADRGEVATLPQTDDERVRAVVKLNRFVDAYLVVGRFIDADALSHIERTAEAVAQYQRVEERGGEIFVTFVLIFAMIAVLLLLAAVWTGLTLSAQISAPITRLIMAADRIRHGDHGVRVDTSEAVEELETLGRAFNRMTGQLETQRDSLIVANRQLDERRRFTETVLSGVTAGVIGLDQEGRINLPNRSASTLIGAHLEAAVGASLNEVVPEMSELFEKARSSPDRTWESEIALDRHGKRATLFVRIVAEQMREQVVGFVVTFDDISPLVAAQRTAAWADVARRVAHEIKNPLTPIQLSAERLKRRYASRIDSDDETFGSCIDTIGRRVEDIRRMVDEFSSFARMPRPEMKGENLAELLRQAVFLERERSPGIRFELNLPPGPIALQCDSRQIGQAFTNLLKNAAEAISESSLEPKDGGTAGTVSITASREDGAAPKIRVIVEDTGPGLPGDLMDRLTEPYVTTRTKGTGLGLAIVRKIVEDHGAELLLENREGGGARVTLVFDGAGDPAAEVDAARPRRSDAPGAAGPKGGGGRAEG